MLDPLPQLDTTRLRLRQMGEGDVDALFSIFGDPEVMVYWSSPALESRDGAAALLADIDEMRTKQTLFQWGVELRESETVIGTCTLYEWDRDNRRASIGYALGRQHWGQGFATEALGALISFAFESLDLHRLEADVDPHNVPSVRVVERLGFIYEGSRAERWFVHGIWHDSLMYGLVRPKAPSGGVS